MRKFIALSLLLCLGYLAFAQNSEDEKIKSAIQAERDAIKGRNIEAWKSTWRQDAGISSTFISRYDHNTRKGWDSLLASVERNFKQNPASNPDEIGKFENFNIRTHGNMAMANYDAAMNLPSGNQPAIYPYLEAVRLNYYDMLEKEEDQWKLASRIVTVTAFNNGNKDYQIESDLNGAGYDLLNEKKINEAIEVFKLNAKLFSNSWNTYDSLGEAYAESGNKKLAIENYEKSIKLNPKNESGKAALIKLKQLQK